jgi:hypothetical protein
MRAEDRFDEVFNVVEQYLEERYELPVVITEVPHPFTGDLDGAEIRVDYDLSAEESVFILAHLFGHTVQWNLSAADREIGRKVETNLPESRSRRSRAMSAPRAATASKSCTTSAFSTRSVVLPISPRATSVT